MKECETSYYRHLHFNAVNTMLDLVISKWTSGDGDIVVSECGMESVDAN